MEVLLLRRAHPHPPEPQVVEVVAVPKTAGSGNAAAADTAVAA